MVAKEDRGFASMDRSKQREIASKGGKAAHQKGTAHEWTSEEAREAGRKGGMASHRRKQEQQAPKLARPAEPTRLESREQMIAATRRHAVSSASPSASRDALAGPRLRAAIIGSSRPFVRVATGTGRSSNGRTRGSGPRLSGFESLPPSQLARFSSLVGCSARLQASTRLATLAALGTNPCLPANSRRRPQTVTLRPFARVSNVHR